MAAVYEGHDPAGHVLVDACQPFHLHRHAGLLGNLAYYSLLKRLVSFEDAARWLPAAVVSALDHQHSSSLVDYDAGDAHGVDVLVRHVGLLVCNASACLDEWRSGW